MAKPLTEVSLTTFAQWVGITTRQATNLRQAGLPSHPQKNGVMVEWPEGLQWYLKRKAGEASPTQEAKARTGVRLAEVELELRELELAKAKGELVDVGYLRAQVTALLHRLRAKMLNAPGKYAPQMVGIRSTAESETRLSAIFRECMTSMQDTGEDPELDDVA